MTENSELSARKFEHIRINLEKDVASSISTGLDDVQFVHQALPEMDLEEVETGLSLFGRRLSFPLLISCITGGTAEAQKINETLSTCAQAAGIAMGVGSQRAGLEHPETAYTFQVRKFAPDVLIFANLGAVQLNYSYTLDHCKRAVEMAQADALVLHLNPLQEALQPEGDTHFKDLARKIGEVVKGMPVPVVAKEVGWGISEQTARMLADAGVSAIDVAGAGGTSWSQVEMFRTKDPVRARAAASFRGWGIPTARSIEMVRKAAPEMKIIASGGLRNGIDLAKALALGACMGGMAGLFLKTAVISEEETMDLIRQTELEFRISMFAAGVKTLQELSRVALERTGAGA